MEIRQWPEGWVTRAAGMDDVGRVLELMNARSQRLYGENQITREDIEAWWKSPWLDLDKDMRLVLDARGNLAGIANIGNPGEPYADISCAGVTHPLCEGRSDVWDWMHEWSLERARELVPLAPEGIRVAGSSAIAKQDRARAAALERAGFSAVRVANHMRIDLSSEIPAPRWPEGVSVRTVNVERDLRGIVALYFESWRDHWDFIERPFDQVLSDWREQIESEG